MSQTLWFLVETLASLLATACILRAYMNWIGVISRDPIGQFIIAVTDWLVRPLRRVVPGSRGIDWSSVVAAALIALLLALVYLSFVGRLGPSAVGAAVVFAIYYLLKWSLYLLMGVVLLSAILSWVNPSAPIAPTLNALTRPFLAPVRRIIPLVGGVDLSPLVILIVVQVLLGFLASTFVPGMLRLIGG
ncbi:MAG: YggT family protein [Burkholderiaceae bacterium]|jgi:YggT family protein|nr:YggT family protein [Burkholderiaceae bacterium]MEB2319290.1 YggT family protein [Pseudomonadota bacterium]